MEQAATVEVKGLKCDTSDCNYADMSINSKDYEQYIDAPCPECGASLLTQADYDSVQEIFEVTKIMNEMFPPETLSEDEVETKFKLDMDGSGAVKVSEISTDEPSHTDECP